MSKNIKIGILVVILIALVGAIYYFFGPPAKDRTVVTDVVERVVNEELELSFAYKSGETALSSIESQPEQLGGSSLKKMYVLMEAKSMIDFQNKADGTETPPTISVMVFDPSLVPSPSTIEATSTTAIDKIKNWAIANNGFTNINSVIGQVEKVEVDGAPAIKYKTDGLYKQDVYIARFGGKMYLFVGQYLEDGDYLDTSFDEVVESVWFQ